MMLLNLLYMYEMHMHSMILIVIFSAPLHRAVSMDNPVVLPTFTVTINPMEDNEMTYVPDSPPEVITDKCKTLSETPGKNIKPIVRLNTFRKLDKICKCSPRIY